MSNEQLQSDEFRKLREIVRVNGVDAWDLGYQGVFSPSEIDRAVNEILKRYGYAKAEKLIKTLKKR